METEWFMDDSCKGTPKLESFFNQQAEGNVQQIESVQDISRIKNLLCHVSSFKGNFDRMPGKKCVK